MRELTGAMARKVASYPAHVQAGIAAYRAALLRREDWHAAVAAAVEAALAARDVPLPLTSPPGRAPILKPYQRWRHPPGCPDADWCSGNGLCYWNCEGPEDE